MLNELNNNAQAVGLSINDGKTKWMKNAVCPQFSIKLDGKDIELVDQYPYLGQIVNMDNDLGRELSKRKRSAWTAFVKHKDIFYDKKVASSTKADLFNSAVLPVLLYGCETWNTTLAEERKLAVTQRAMERRIVGVSRLQHITNEELRSKSGVKDVVEEMFKRKSRWAGHVARMKDNRWTKRILEWYPRDVKRPRGRPPTRWEDPLRQIYGVTWMRAAQNRSEWRRCGLRQYRENRH